jgi:hypothetical protein
VRVDAELRLMMDRAAQIWQLIYRLLAIIQAEGAKVRRHGRSSGPGRL